MGSGTKAHARVSHGDPADRSGRERELRRAGDVFAEEATRLVTLTGPPGVGKTWTARELRRRLVAERGWPATTVHMGGGRGFSELMAATAEALGMPAGGGVSRSP